MSGLCRDCRWWADYPNPEMAVVIPLEVRRFCALTEILEYEPVHPESLARPAGAGAHWKRLETFPDFGCVQWEAKVTG